MSEFYYREDTALIQVTAKDGAGNVIFAGEQCWSIEGGDAEAATEHVFPGNMETSVAIGGLVTPADVTVEMRYTDITCVYVGPLKRGATSATVIATVIPRNGPSGVGELNEAGKLEWQGVLKSVKPPKRASSASGKTMITIVFTPDGE
jgi:hypothetical protein